MMPNEYMVKIYLMVYQMIKIFFFENLALGVVNLVALPYKI
jgi:hypothetical protein